MSSSNFPRKPNIMVIMTDQQRAIRDFPPAWVDENLKSLNALRATGMEYTNSYVNTAPCWCNRSVMISGMYPLVTQVLSYGTSLPPSLSNFANIMNGAGYEVVYKGKWHLTSKSDNFAGQWASEPTDEVKKTVNEEDKFMANEYGMNGWTSPDAGTSLVTLNATKNGIANLGGGNGQNDSRVIHGTGMIDPDSQESVVDFLKNRKQPEKPWCLFVSLVNPHDISTYPDAENLKTCGYNLEDFNHWEGWNLPESYFADNLETKPDAQLNMLNGFDGGKMDKETALTYLKFYAYLQKCSDDLIGDVLATMTEEQRNNTIIIRTADHGEMGAAHGGLREKMNVFYEEMANIPLIVSNPILFPEGRKCHEMVGQIDVLPTVAELVGLDPMRIKKEYHLQGNSFAHTLKDPHAPTSEFVLYTFFSGNNYTNVSPPGDACIIYGIVSKEWKYAVYFAPTNKLPSPETYPGAATGATFPIDGAKLGTNLAEMETDNWFPIVTQDFVQFELYNLKNDPKELDNMLYHGSPNYEKGVEMQRTLHRILTTLAMENNSMPMGWMDIALAQPIPANS